MDFLDNNTKPEALDQLLKQYLVERNPVGPEGESLMEVAAGAVLVGAPLVSPSPEREAEMIARLKDGVSPAPPPSPPPAGSGGSIWSPGLKMAALGISVAAIGLTAFLIVANPFAGKLGEQINPITGNNPQDLLSVGEYNNRPDNANPPTHDLSAMNTPKGDGNDVSMLTPKGKQPIGDGARKNVKNNPQPVAVDDNSGDPLIPARDLNVIPVPDLDDNNIQPATVDPFPLKDLFAQTTIPSQSLEIASQKDQLIIGKNGTLFHIPQDAFVDLKGNPARGKVELEIKEIYTPSDYLRSNLPTLTNDLQLVSGGIIYLKATASNGPLKLAPGKDIYFEFDPKNGANARDMVLSAGNFDKTGHINWEILPEKPTKMVPLPADKLYFQDFWCVDHHNDQWNETLSKLLWPEYDNTWIVTREFRQRLEIAWKFDHKTTILETYLANTDKELWQVDLLVAEQLMNDYSNYQGQHFSQYKDEYFQRFASERLTKVENYTTYGLDISSGKSYDQLVKKVGQEEADRIMRVHKLREKYVTDMETAIAMSNPKRSGTKEGQIAIENKGLVLPHQGFLSESTGWIHLNKFMNPQKVDRRGVDLQVELIGDLPGTQTSTYLVYPEERSILSAADITSNKAQFTKAPSDKDVWIVAIGYDNEIPYIGMKKIKLFKDGTEKIRMKQTNLENLVEELKQLD